MDTYNFKMFDKNIEPTSQSITKQLQKAPNVCRMFFTSNDSFGNANTPSFNIQTNTFNNFDPNRPIYCTLDYFSMTSAQSFTRPYNLVWLTAPFNTRATWYSNNAYKNILGVFQGNGSNFNFQRMPYVLNQQDLINNGVWSFAFVDDQHNAVPSLNCSTFIFSICFFQD